MHVTRRRTVFYASLLGLVAPALAQDTADPVDPVEDKALHQEAQAKFDEALATFRQAFDACVQQAKTGGAARDRNLARAEVLLEKIDSLSERVTKRGETEKFLAAYDGKDLGPVLEASVRMERAEDLLSEGDRPGATAVLEPLGIARHYWIVGPYDNERGRDFKQSHEPEKSIDLEGKYKGKEREIAWREVQADQTLGYVDLDAMLRPNDQASAYAVAFAKFPADVDAALRVGSDEAIRGWWNGKEVLARDVRRQMGFDQDVVGIHAKAGWNVMLLKVHDQTGPWGFRARLTAADGSPLSGVTWAMSRAEADEAIKAKTTSADFAGTVAAGAKQFYDAAAGKGGGQAARDLFHLGWLHFRRHFDSIADRQAENLLKKAADAEPGNAVFRFHYSEAAAPPADLVVEKEENRQREGREKAIAADPNYAVAYRALAGYYTTSVVNLERAEQLLRKALEVNPDFWQARLDLAGVLDRRGLAPAASAERDKALASAAAAKNEDAARTKAAELEKKGMGPDASAAWREVLALDARGDDVRRRVAELAAAALDSKTALAVLDEICAANPYDVGSRARKAEILEGLEDWSGAEKSIQDALKIAPEDDNLIQALGRVQEKAGKDKEAIASFREALRVNPKLQQLERYVEFLDPAAAPFEDDYRTDVAPLVAKVKDYKNDENDGWVTVLDQTVTRVNGDGTSSTYTHVADKILTDAGVKRFQRYRPFARFSDAFKWRVARVLHADGTVVEAKTSSGGRGGRMAEFPPLTPGDVIDVEYRTDDREQTVFGTYFGDVNYFADVVPVKQSTWTLVTPATREFYFHQKNFDVKPEVSMRDDGKTRVYTWTALDMPKIKREPGMPAETELYPQVQVTTYKDWDDFAKWWWNFIREQQTVNPGMQEKIKELTAGKETRLEKLRAIYEFVTGDITYKAVPWGPHGYQPYTTTAIFEKREGDCKDKALLLRTMCKEVGIEVFPVLINGEDGLRSDEDLSIAMLGDFNHCIAYVPDSDGKGTPLFLDGTAEYQTVHSAPASFDQGARVVIVTPDGAKVSQIPNDPPEKNGVVQKWKIAVQPDGGATAQGRVEAVGDYAYQIRQGFSVEGQRADELQKLAAVSFGKAKVASSKFSDLKDRSAPDIWIEATVEAPTFAKASGDVYTLQTQFLPLSMGWSRYLDAASAPKTREHDAVMPVPMRFRTEADYELPAGWTVDAPPKDAEIKNASVEYTCKSTVNGTTLHMERELRLTGVRVKAADFAAFKDAVQQMKQAASQTWKVKKGDAPAPQK